MLYVVKAIQGAGLGCVAVRPVDPGELLQSEEPGLLLHPGDQQHLHRVLQAFREMTQIQQAFDGILSNEIMSLITFFGSILPNFLSKFSNQYLEWFKDN